MQTPHTILKQYWRHESFRHLQEEIINSVINGEDVLAILPTGGGKSICFQIPALMKDGICIVVTPLIALMKDQVENLIKRGVSAVAIYSGMNPREIDVVLDNCIYGNIKFLYVSPERLHSHLFQERVNKMNVNLITVDEAHCISQWGHDFRPSYFEISQLRLLKPESNTIALTATATPEVRDEIVEKLDFKKFRLFTGSFARENLSYAVRKVEDKEQKLLEVLTKTSGTAIVYTKTRKEAKMVSEWLKRNGINSGYYHAGLSNQLRIRVQDQWMSGKLRVVVATNAFGMGIDKANVRMVIHLGLNSNMESYYQEAGRAGRDGMKAYAVILFQTKDIEDARSNFNRAYPKMKYIQHIYQCLANYYKLAVGSSHASGFDFILHKFATQYNLEHLEVFYALKKLEEHNLIQFSEVYDAASAVYMQFDQSKLYQFQVANPLLDPLIKAILRMYGGEMFTQFTRISEYKISKVLNTTEKNVKKDLQRLHKVRAISYSQQKDLPQIVFLTPRMDAGKLPVQKHIYELRRKVELDKLEFMISYVSKYEACRTNLIQEYFGEETKTECGVCDRCIEKKKKGETIFQTLHDQIVEKVEEEKYNIRGLVNKFSSYPDKDILGVVREMLESGELMQDNSGFITRT